MHALRNNGGLAARIGKLRPFGRWPANDANAREGLFAQKQNLTPRPQDAKGSFQISAFSFQRSCFNICANLRKLRRVTSFGFAGIRAIRGLEIFAAKVGW
jgi:hypothetical protein